MMWNRSRHSKVMDVRGLSKEVGNKRERRICTGIEWELPAEHPQKSTDTWCIPLTCRIQNAEWAGCGSKQRSPPCPNWIRNPRSRREDGTKKMPFHSWKVWVYMCACQRWDCELTLILWRGCSWCFFTTQFPQQSRPDKHSWQQNSRPDGCMQEEHLELSRAANPSCLSSSSKIVSRKSR